MEAAPELGERLGRGLRDDAVAEEVELVGMSAHPAGKPIIHSTNRGLRSIAPLPVLSPVDDDPGSIPRTATSVSVAPELRPLSGVQLPATPLALQSVAVGVGKVPRAISFATPSCNVAPSVRSRSLCEGVRLQSLAVGVGIIGIPRAARVWSDIVPPLGRSLFDPFWLDPYADAVSVGSKEVDSIALVRGSHAGRADTDPFRSPPALCQIPEDFLERAATVNAKEAGHVLDEEPPSPEGEHVSPDERPQPSLVVDAESLSGDAGALAGEACSDEIHAVAIEVAREGFQIAVDRTWIQGIFDHSTCEDGSGVGLPLNSTHKTNSGASTLDAKAEPAVSGAEFEHGSGTNRYMVHCAHCIAVNRAARGSCGLARRETRRSSDLAPRR